MLGAPGARIQARLMPDFMYMGYYDAQRHIQIHAYKHIETRRTLYVDTQGGLWWAHSRAK